MAACAWASILWDGRNRELLWLGLIAIFTLVAQRLSRQVPAGVHLGSGRGSLGLTVTAPAAYSLATQELNRVSFAYGWRPSCLPVIRIISCSCTSTQRGSTVGPTSSSGRSFLVGELLLAIVLLLAWRFQILPGLAALSFLPLLVRGTAWLFECQKPLVVRKLGWTELARAVIFGGLFTAGFHFGR